MTIIKNCSFVNDLCTCGLWLFSNFAAEKTINQLQRFFRKEKVFVFVIGV